MSWIARVPAAVASSTVKRATDWPQLIDFQRREWTPLPRGMLVLMSACGNVLSPTNPSFAQGGRLPDRLDLK
jgi:hypothetical protein